MQRFLVTVLLCVGILAQKPAIRGLSPKDAKIISYDSISFQCKDSSKTIPFTKVNDDFCDCNDGSDEPGTNACHNGKFWCINKNHVGNFISTMFLNDGVCDCCDGSDEYVTKSCPDTCAELAAKEKQLREMESVKAREGLEKKKEYIEEAKKEIEAKKTKLLLLDEELKTLQEEKEQLKVEKEKAEEEQKRVTEEVLKLREDSETTEQEEAEHEHEHEHDHEHEHEHSEEAEGDEEEEEETVAPYKVEEDPAVAPLVEAAREAKTRFEQAERRVMDAEREASDIRKLLESADYGTDLQFYHLRGKCLTADSGEYTYELCPFDKVNQKSRGGYSSTLIGRWETPESSDKWRTSDWKTMVYSNGAQCWGGPARSAHVQLVCDSQVRIDHISEPAKCEYHLTLYTPAACKELDTSATNTNKDSDDINNNNNNNSNNDHDVHDEL